MTFKLTWRNLWRNPRRSLITMSSVAFAVMLAIVMGSLQKGIFDNLIRDVVSFYSGYLQVHHEGYWDEQVLEESFPEDAAMVRKLSQIEGVKAVVPRLETFALASVGSLTKGCLVAGTEPERERAMTRLPEKLSAGEYLDGRGKGILIGEGLARKLQVGVDDTVILLGQGYQGSMAAGKYRVLGLLRFGAPQLNDAMVYMDLVTARQFTGAENLLTSLAFALENPQDLARIQQAVRKVSGPGYEVMTWGEMMPEISNHIKADRAGLYVMIGILYSIIAFGLFSTVLMMMAERRYEFGMLIAIGMKKSRLALTLVMENLFITIIGTLAGMAVSLPLVMLLKQKPLRLTGNVAEAYEKFGFEAIFPAALDGAIFLNQALTVMVLALVIGLYPIVHVARINPVMAMKK
jgi:ABC-type lipoprotein release transport system permease subunit